jgi:hypothetical protein
MNVLQNELTRHLVVPAMPFQDAIDLAEFLVDLTISKGYSPSTILGNWRPTFGLKMKA